ncbi:hypothetical protein FRB99_007971 [Tulasnella sp. 403]|nr:hypothetical protein FRB99_007971 [Tulasnella sp. 403]
MDFSYDFDDQQHDSQPTQDEIILQLTKDLEQYKELTDIMKEQRERDHQELSIANEQLEELDATRAKVDNLSRELENTRAVVNAKDASITGLNADMNGLRTELQKVQDGLARAEEALLSAETRHADEVSELHTEVANLQAGNTEANELLVQLRAERDELNAFLIEADKVTASIRASLDGVSGDLELAKQEKAELAAQVENGRQAQTQILAESEAQGRRILDLEGELRVRDGLVNELQNSTIPSLKQKIVSLDSQLTTSQSIHRELATSISQYQTNLARSHQELDHARASCQLLHESLSSTNAQLIVLSKKINDLTAGLAMASGAAANLQNHMNSHTFA